MSPAIRWKYDLISRSASCQVMRDSCPMLLLFRKTVGVDAECVDIGYAFVRPTVVKFHFQIGSVDW